MREKLVAVFGENQQLHAELLEDYMNLTGFEGYFATYIHGKTDGTLDEILGIIAREWLRQINYQGDVAKYEFGLFTKGFFHKKWCIDLAWGWAVLAGSANYYVRLTKVKT